MELNSRQDKSIVGSRTFGRSVWNKSELEIAVATFTFGDKLLRLFWNERKQVDAMPSPAGAAIAVGSMTCDGCWVGELCHKRRTYYKKRDLYNRNRRLKYRGDKESEKQLDSINIPTVPAVIIYFYRGRKDEPLYALSVELWVGQQKKDSRKPVHTLGWKEANVREYIKDAIAQARTQGFASFSQQYGFSISGVAATVEINPSLCPLAPCPLKVGVEKP